MLNMAVTFVPLMSAFKLQNTLHYRSLPNKEDIWAGAKSKQGWE